MHDKPLVVKLLGIPELLWKGAPVMLSRRQARALLYRLAAQTTPVSRDALMLLFWPDSPESTARRNLTRLVSYLRNALPHPNLLQTAGNGVLLDPELSTSDAVVFSQYLDRDDEANWEAAVHLVNGPFLETFSLPGSDEFDRWLSTMQQEIERHYLATLSRLMTVRTAAADYPAAIDYAQQYLAADDLAEEIHRRLISLYAATGQRSAALRQFESCVEVLERELGVEPLPETRSAYEAALDGAVTPPAAAPSIHPAWSTLPGLDLPLLGRESAWQEVTRAYTHSRNGGVILISGPAGIGKSRLLQEFATAQNSLVLTGNSQADGQTMPYQPLVQALRQALPLHDHWRHAASIWLAEASRLLPELALQFPGLPQPVEVEARQAQSRLFEALFHLFQGLAGETGLLLCLDDVHWADEATRGWLQYVSGRLAGSRICILATYRAGQAAELRPWLRSLARADSHAEVSLDGLTTRAISALLREIDAHMQEPRALTTRIHEATGGNAFFVLETVRELLEAGQLKDPPAELPLPETVRDAVLRRAGRLSPLAHQILEVAAVLSPVLSLPVICQTAGRDELETAACLEQLVSHHLLAEAPRLHFHHALARDAVYQSVSGWRRQLLHRRAGNVLAKLPAEENGGLGTIAAHFDLAGSQEQAIEYYRRAAERAQSVYAHQEAINYLRRAIKLANGSSKSGVLPGLHESLADSLAGVADFAAAEASYRQALSLAPPGQSLRVAELKRKLASTLPPQDRQAEAETHYREALAQLDGPPPPAVSHQWRSARLNILLGLLDALYFQHRPGAMAELMELTKTLLAEVGTAAQRAHFYSRLNQIEFLRNRRRIPAESIARARKALDFALESDDERHIARQQFHLGFHVLWHGDPEGAEAWLSSSLSTAERLGDFWLQVQCRVYLTIAFRFQDDISECARRLPRLAELAQRVGNLLYIGVSQANRAWLHYRGGEWRQAQAQAKAALASWAAADYPFEWLAHWLLLDIALRQERPSDAMISVRAMLDARQMRFPDEISSQLEAAISAWDAGAEGEAYRHLKQSVELARRDGYL